MSTPALQHIRPVLSGYRRFFVLSGYRPFFVLSGYRRFFAQFKKNLIVISRQQLHGTPPVHGVDRTRGIFCSASLRVTEVDCRRHTAYSSPVRDPHDKRQLLRHHRTLSSDYSVFPDRWQLLTAPRRHGFDPGPIRVRLVVDTVALGQVPL